MIRNIISLMIICISLNANDFKKYEIGCENNISSECRERAYLALEVNKSYDEAEKYFLKACELNDAKSCSLLGYMYRSKNAKKRDEKKYFQFFDKACKLGDGNACTVIGSIFYSRSAKNNEVKVRQTDIFYSTKYYERACYFGDQRGCKQLGRHYLLGYGVKQDKRKAIKIFKSDCQLSSEGCYMYVGIIGKNSENEDLNISEFTRLTKDCDVNSSCSCNKLGFLSLEVYQDYDEAERYFTKACQLKNQESCKMLGFIYKNKHTGKQDFKKSFKYFSQACELGNGYACFYLGAMYFRGEGSKKNINLSRASYHKACILGHNRGCTALGDYYRLGQSVKKDKIKAITLYKQSCYDNSLACIKYIDFSTQN